MRNPEDFIGKKVRCFSGFSRAVTHHLGTVIGYCAAPMFVVETPDGRQIHWRADLTEEDMEVEDQLHGVEEARRQSRPDDVT